jgi:hypothetical protein
LYLLVLVWVGFFNLIFVMISFEIIFISLYHFEKKRYLSIKFQKKVLRDNIGEIQSMMQKKEEEDV